MDYSYLGGVINKTERVKLTNTLCEPDHGGGEESWIKAVRSQVNSLRFGVVQIVVHDSRVVQIERTEKIRFDKTASE